MCGRAWRRSFPEEQRTKVRRGLVGDQCADVELARVLPVPLLGSLSNRVAPRLRARQEEDDRREIVLEVPVVERRLEVVIECSTNTYIIASGLRCLSKPRMCSRTPIADSRPGVAAIAPLGLARSTSTRRRRTPTALAAALRSTRQSESQPPLQLSLA